MQRLNLITNRISFLTRLICASVALMSLCLPATATAQSKGIYDKKLAPASKFDLSHWYITLPVDLNRDGKAELIFTADGKINAPNGQNDAPVLRVL